MSEELDAYKVVRENNYKYKSATDLGIVTFYKLNEWVEPKKGNGAFACFSNIKDAQAFINFVSSYVTDRCLLKIYKIKYKLSNIKVFGGYFYLGDCSVPIYKTFIGMQSYTACGRSGAPVGTIFASAVKLLEKV